MNRIINFSIIILVNKMNYFIEELIAKNSWYTTEIVIAIIIGILLMLAIIILTIIKKAKDK